MTGPTVFTNAIHAEYFDKYGETFPRNKFHQQTNQIFECNDPKMTKYRLYGVDYNGVCTFSYMENVLLFSGGKKKWNQEQMERPLM